MLALLTAIRTKFNATSALSALGTLHFGQVPENTARPFCRYVVLGNPTEQAYETKFSLETGRIQFDIWANGNATALGYIEALHLAFDNVVLTLTPTTGTEKNIESTRVLGGVPLYDGRDESGQEVYRATSEYKFVVHRQNA